MYTCTLDNVQVDRLSYSLLCLTRSLSCLLNILPLGDFGITLKNSTPPFKCLKVASRSEMKVHVIIFTIARAGFIICRNMYDKS